MASSPKTIPLEDLRVLQDLLRARLPVDVAELPGALDELEPQDLILRDLQPEEFPADHRPVKSSS